jgi:hypothetical protein
MNPYERNAYSFYERLLGKAELKESGAFCFKANFQLMSKKLKLKEFIKSGKKDPIEYEKLKNELIKHTYQKIKHSKNFKNQFQYRNI